MSQLVNWKDIVCPTITYFILLSEHFLLHHYFKQI